MSLTKLISMDLCGAKKKLGAESCQQVFDVMRETVARIPTDTPSGTALTISVRGVNIAVVEVR